MIPPAFDLDRVVADVHWLVQELGPRPYRSDAEVRAADGVRDRLDDAGWTVRSIRSTSNQVACRGTGRTLFLAHIDTVRESPGAVDNAAGVAVLIELARTSQATDLCLAFPMGEERGFVGSRWMAKQWSAKIGPLPELVVSLDLVGHGNLAVTGLGPTWGTSEQRWLFDRIEVDSPFPYRVFSRMAPHMERSDHAPFAELGIPAVLLFGRDADHVFPRYHQPDDTLVENRALGEIAAALERLATAPPIERGSADPAVAIFNRVIPGWVSWLTIAAGIGSGAVDWRRWRGLLGSAWRTVVAMLVAGAVCWGISRLGFAGATPERTAETLMNVPATGWWNAAPWAIGGGWLAWLLSRWRLGGRGSGALAAAIATTGALALDATLALPFAIAALLARVHPLLALLPAMILLRPSAVRELSFHGLLDPALWGVFWVLAWPAFGARRGAQ